MNQLNQKTWALKIQIEAEKKLILNGKGSQAKQFKRGVKTMSEEYYVNVDKEKLELQVCKYVFDKEHPRGYEKVLSRISYKYNFIFKEAFSIASNLVNVLNNTDWRKENDVYEEKVGAS